MSETFPLGFWLYLPLCCLEGAHSFNEAESRTTSDVADTSFAAIFGRPRSVDKFNGRGYFVDA